MTNFAPINWASLTQGAEIVEVSSPQERHVVSSANNILNDTEDLLWMSSTLPQHLVIRIPRDHPPIRYFGWFAWQHYLTNPKEVELSSGVIPDCLSNNITATGLPGAGKQLWELTSPIPEGHEFIKIAITATFGASTTYMNRLYLYSDHPGDGFSTPTPTSSTLMEQQQQHRQQSARTAVGGTGEDQSPQSNVMPNSPLKMTSMLKDLDHEIRMLHPLRNVSPARSHTQIHSGANSNYSATAPAPPQQQADFMGAQYQHVPPPLGGGGAHQHLNISQGSMGATSFGGGGGGGGTTGSQYTSPQNQGRRRSSSGQYHQAEAQHHQQQQQQQHFYQPPHHVGGGGSDAGGGGGDYGWQQRENITRLSAMEASIGQLVDLVKDQRSEIEGLRNQLLATQQPHRSASQQQAADHATASPAPVVLQGTSGNTTTHVVDDEILKRYVEEAMAPKLDKYRARIESRVLQRVDSAVRDIESEVSSIVDDKVRRYLYEIAMDRDHPYHYHFKQAMPQQAAATAASASHSHSHSQDQHRERKSRSGSRGNSRTTSPSRNPTPAMTTSKKVRSTSSGGGDHMKVDQQHRPPSGHHYRQVVEDHSLSRVIDATTSSRVRESDYPHHHHHRSVSQTEEFFPSHHQQPAAGGGTASSSRSKKPSSTSSNKKTHPLDGEYYY